MNNCSVTRVGDVAAVQFADEQNVLLFVGGSSEVVTCSSQDWQQLLDDHNDPVSDLALTLQNLGAQLA